MSEHGFTPGPWCVEEDEVWDTLSSGDPGIPLFRPDYGGYRLWGRDVSRSEIEANARLIAASPTLLEALEGMLRAFSPHPREDTEGWREEHGAWEAARAAITLATGKDA